MQWSIVVAGTLVGLLAVVLVKFGNPANMGVCVACFVRDITGALGLHRAETVQYLRPEIPGFILGSFAIAAMGKEFRPRGGSSPLVRFVLGFFVMIGALVFLGCPLRAILRLANGDLNALLGLVGFTTGIVTGIQFIRNGYSLGRSYRLPMANGLVMPLLAVGLIALAAAKPAFAFFSQKGPGSLHAPLLLSLAAGLVIGAVLQRTRLCTAGGIRDALLLKDFHLLWGLAAIFMAGTAANLIFGGTYKLAFAGQPVAHTDGLWNFLGMMLAGWGSVLLGGCPLRQTILAGEGDADAAVTLLGLVAGAAFAHNFGLAASPAGVPLAGKVAVIAGMAVVAAIGGLAVLSVKNTLLPAGGIGVGQ